MDKEEVMSSEDKEDFDYAMESLFHVYHGRLGKNEHQKKADIRSIRVIIDQLLQLDESIVFTKENTEGYSIVVAWAQDFVLAASEQSKLLRILLRFCLGRYAFREFLGMIKALQGIGYVNSDLKNTNYMCYNCKDQGYHNDLIPFDWSMANSTLKELEK